jgi:hypothetical protein
MPLAWMVDLGWPWWVTTVVAAVVATACVLALTRTRDRLVRGALATLAVQGVALAVAAPFVMDESEATSKSAAAAMRDHEGPPLALGEFVRRADENCRRFGEFAGTLGNPTTLPGMARQLDKLVPAFWDSFAAQGRLEPPREARVTDKRWMFAMEAFGHDLEAVRAAAKSGDQEGVDAANRAAGQHSARSAVLSRKLGLKVCFAP